MNSLRQKRSCKTLDQCEPSRNFRDKPKTSQSFPDLQSCRIGLQVDLLLSIILGVCGAGLPCVNSSRELKPGAGISIG